MNILSRFIALLLLPAFPVSNASVCALAVLFSRDSAFAFPKKATGKLLTDVSGTTATSVSVRVTVTPARPNVSLTYPVAYSAFAPGDAVQVQATASPGTAGSAVTQVEFLVNGSVVGIDPSAPYAGSWTAPAANGDYTLTARATDAVGQTTTSADILVRVVPDPSTPLVAELDPALDGSTITAPTPVVGNVGGPTLASWKVEYRREGSECADWVALASGAQSVAVGGTLGTFDPTKLLNGIYEVRLTARDAFGGSVVSSNCGLVGDSVDGVAPSRHGFPSPKAHCSWETVAHARVVLRWRDKAPPSTGCIPLWAICEW